MLPVQTVCTTRVRTPLSPSVLCFTNVSKQRYTVAMINRGSCENHQTNTGSQGPFQERVLESQNVRVLSFFCLVTGKRWVGLMRRSPPYFQSMEPIHRFLCLLKKVPFQVR